MVPRKNTIWCYGIYQPANDDMLRTLPNITFVKGVPGDLETLINPSIRNLVVIDDLMQELRNDQRMTNLFTKGCHHRSLSVIFILQNIFHGGKELSDSSQVYHLARHMFPGHVKNMQEAFDDATKRPCGYLFSDPKRETPTDFRLRTNIFPGESQYAYVRKV